MTKKNLQKVAQIQIWILPLSQWKLSVKVQIDNYNNMTGKSVDCQSDSQIWTTDYFYVGERIISVFWKSPNFGKIVISRNCGEIISLNFCW